jgi:hypothetical protein
MRPLAPAISFRMPSWDCWTPFAASAVWDLPCATMVRMRSGSPQDQSGPRMEPRVSPFADAIVAASSWLTAV